MVWRCPILFLLYGKLFVPGQFIKRPPFFQRCMNASSVIIHVINKASVCMCACLQRTYAFALSRHFPPPSDRVSVATVLPYGCSCSRFHICIFPHQSGKKFLYSLILRFFWTTWEVVNSQGKPFCPVHFMLSGKAGNLPCRCLWGVKVFTSRSPYSQGVALWAGGSHHNLLSLRGPGLCPLPPASHGTVKTEAGIHLGGKCRINEDLFRLHLHFPLSLSFGDS